MITAIEQHPNIVEHRAILNPAHIVIDTMDSLPEVITADQMKSLWHAIQEIIDNAGPGRFGSDNSSGYRKYSANIIALLVGSTVCLRSSEIISFRNILQIDKSELKIESSFWILDPDHKLSLDEKIERFILDSKSTKTASLISAKAENVLFPTSCFTYLSETITPEEFKHHCRILSSIVEQFEQFAVLQNRAKAVKSFYLKVAETTEIWSPLLVDLVLGNFSKTTAVVEEHLNLPEVKESVYTAQLVKQFMERTKTLQVIFPEMTNTTTFIFNLHRALGVNLPRAQLLSYEHKLYLNIIDLSVEFVEKPFNKQTFEAELLKNVANLIEMGHINSVKMWLATTIELTALLQKFVNEGRQPKDRTNYMLPLQSLLDLIENMLKPSLMASTETDEVRRNIDVIDLQTAHEQLEALVGLTEMKDKINEFISILKINKLRKEAGLKTANVNNHLVFAGNPGTAKTTVARLLSKICKDLDYLSVGHLVEVSRGDLVGQHIGATAPLTTKKFMQAMGGVLFIDEAYALNGGSSNDFGQEAISTLMKLMEDFRSDVIVIVAGYTKEMEKFLDSNPGFKSRFSKTLIFPEYSSDEMLLIFRKMVTENGYKMSSKVEEEFVKLIPTTRDKSFGNGRWVRSLFEGATINQAVRLDKMVNVPTVNQLKTITVEDLPEIEEIKNETSFIGFQ